MTPLHEEIKDCLVPRGECPMCGCSEAKVHMDFAEFSVHECVRCSYLFSGKILRSDALDKYYAQDFGGKRNRAGQKVVAKANLVITQKLLGEQLEPGLKVLDVGCGHGFFMANLQRQCGISAIGVEPSLKESAHARDVLAQNVVTGLLSEASPPKGSFDLIVCFEVIEHVALPKAFVAELSEYLKPGGRLLIGTDNCRSKVVKAMGISWPKWIPHSHISHFDGESLPLCVKEAADLKVVATQSYTPWECLLMDLKHRLLGRPQKPSFDLENELKYEKEGTLKLAALRGLLSPIWSRLAATPRMDEAMIYVLAEKAE